jgi:hypothetical protein
VKTWRMRGCPVSTAGGVAVWLDRLLVITMMSPVPGLEALTPARDCWWTALPRDGRGHGDRDVVPNGRVAVYPMSSPTSVVIQPRLDAVPIRDQPGAGGNARGTTGPRFVRADHYRPADGCVWRSTIAVLLRA